MHDEIVSSTNSQFYKSCTLSQFWESSPHGSFLGSSAGDWTPPWPCLPSPSLSYCLPLLSSDGVIIFTPALHNCHRDRDIAGSHYFTATLPCPWHCWKSLLYCYSTVPVTSLEVITLLLLYSARDIAGSHYFTATLPCRWHHWKSLFYFLAPADG